MARPSQGLTGLEAPGPVGAVYILYFYISFVQSHFTRQATVLQVLLIY